MNWGGESGIHKVQMRGMELDGDMRGGKDIDELEDDDDEVVSWWRCIALH